MPSDAGKRPGRPRDDTRDAVILEAALDELTSCGYQGMTVDAVAARAKAGKASVYRRWPSKESLAVAAIQSLTSSQPPSEGLPNTGTLRGDLLQLIRDSDTALSQKKVRVLAILAAGERSDADLAPRLQARLLAPSGDPILGVLRRAVQRGEIDASCDVASLALVLPAMHFYRSCILGEPITHDLGQSIVDEVLLPAATISRTS
jgi:AcrR family transcriptional regulator